MPSPTQKCPLEWHEFISVPTLSRGPAPCTKEQGHFPASSVTILLLFINLNKMKTWMGISMKSEIGRLNSNSLSHNQVSVKLQGILGSQAQCSNQPKRMVLHSKPAPEERWAPSVYLALVILTAVIITVHVVHLWLMGYGTCEVRYHFEQLIRGSTNKDHDQYTTLVAFTTFIGFLRRCQK